MNGIVILELFQRPNGALNGAPARRRRCGRRRPYGTRYCTRSRSCRGLSPAVGASGQRQRQGGVMYTLRDIQQEELQIEKYLEIDKLPPGLHKRMKELDDR